MNNYEYYWVKLHHYAYGDKELQSEDFFSIMSKVSKHLRDGWIVTYIKLMNRNE